MKILITGSNGLLGQKLLDLLLTQPEISIVATGRGEDRYPTNEGYTYVTMDITDDKEVNQVVNVHKPDVLINTAAMTNVDECEQNREACYLLNVTAVQNLVEACKETNTFLLHLSTDFIFDGAAGPYKEEDQGSPVSYYGQTKLEAEEIIRQSSLHWAIVRTVLVYGIAHDMSRSNIILWVKNSLEAGKEIKVVNDQWRTPTLAEDLAKGCYLIASKQAEGIFNISGKDFLNPYQMAVMTADYFKLDKSLIKEVDGSIFSQPAKRPPKTGFDISKAREVLGYEPVSFKEGIAFLAGQIAERN